jgi:uncharacterized protein with PQ loop repeat
VIFFKKILQIIFDCAMYLNIIALLPQPINILISKDASSVSVWMWWIFFVMQFAVSLHGKLNLDSKSMFFGMLGSAMVSLVTIFLCYLY